MAVSQGYFILYTFLSLSVSIIVIETAQLPEYLKSCAINDPKLDDCLTRNAQDAILPMTKGDSKFHVPNLKPLEVDEIALHGTGSLNLTFFKVKIYGIENINIQSMKLKRNATHFHFKTQATVPGNLEIRGNYRVVGRILVLPIRGEGPENVTLVDSEFKFNHYFEKETRNGEQFIKLIDHTLKFDCKRAFYQFNNLFEGDERLGREMNNLLNDNWHEVLKDVGDAVPQAIAQVVNSIFTTITSRVQLKNFFKEN